MSEPEQCRARPAAEAAARTRVTVVIIAKECIPGRVKTRLHPPLSLEQAAEVAAASLADTMTSIAAMPFERRVLALDGRMPARQRRGWELMPQTSGTLDQRLGAIFDAISGPMVLVGMDTPQLQARDLATVFDDADPDADAWFGPANDGGFWALGMRQPDGSLIRGVPMSQHDTGRRQLARLRDAGLRVAMLPALTDIDTYAAAADVAALAPDGRFAATLARAGAGFTRPPSPEHGRPATDPHHAVLTARRARTV
jgi:glycosyltransferase A (GT-A) superfamily protein (DUF2064 family)